MLVALTNSGSFLVGLTKGSFSGSLLVGLAKAGIPECLLVGQTKGSLVAVCWLVWPMLV